MKNSLDTHRLYRPPIVPLIPAHVPLPHAPKVALVIHLTTVLLNTSRNKMVFTRGDDYVVRLRPTIEIGC